MASYTRAMQHTNSESQRFTAEQHRLMTEYHQALQRIGTALDLPAGSDLTKDCVPAIERLRQLVNFAKAA